MARSSRCSATRSTAPACRPSPTCARRRAAIGETFCRAGSLNGGFISDLGGATRRKPGAVKACADAATSSVDDRHPVGEAVALAHFARKRRQPASISTSVDREPSARAAPARVPPRRRRRRDRPHVLPACARGRGREQDRVVADAMAAPRLAQHQPPAQHGVLGGRGFAQPSSGRSSWPRPASVSSRRARATESSSTSSRRGSMPSEPSSTLMF